jgi:acyl carrier protein
MFETLRGILVNDLQIGADDAVPTASCAEMGLDSLAMVELSKVLNSRLDIEIHDYELQELATVGDIARLMEERHIDGPAAPRSITTSLSRQRW